MPQQAEQAMQNFFRRGNLIALRELSLRYGAHVDADMRRHPPRPAIEVSGRSSSEFWYA